jgi:hypothetical protein
LAGRLNASCNPPWRKINMINMKNLEAADLGVAWKLLGDFERTTDHRKRLSYFKHAIQLLDHCTEDNLDSDEGLLALNIRHTYIRKLLEELPSLHALNIVDWLKYVLMLSTLGRDVERLLTENRTLKTNFDSFVKIWTLESIDAVNGLQV